MITIYVLKKETFSQGVSTAALWHCPLCGGGISGMGGPTRPDVFCQACGEALLDRDVDKITARLKMGEP